MTKPVILTGLRANNNLTIGNYFGAMLPIIETATQHAGEYQINMFIPDLHSFTTPVDHSQLLDQVLGNARLFAAAGLPLDNDDILLYRQSYVPAHSELTWILDCFTGFGEMRRMTQFKEKSHIKEVARDLFSEGSATLDLQELSGNVSVGLFNYPVLMASDILLYSAQYVPVGDDQTQHLEFTRDIAERMNKRFGDLFTIPEEVSRQHEFFGKGQGLRIKDLMDPTKKMSKSDDSGKGVIFLTDSPEEAAKKVMSATTDDKASVNYDTIEQPGISNLLQILSLLRSQPIDVVEAEFKGQERYGDFKKIVADEIAAFLTDFQAKLASVDDSHIFAAFDRSEAVANQQANATLLKVQQAVGLRPKDR
jgi:tryptophanyl-tRNA synthetase